ncbi:receptor-like protein kinase ANXUR2 [Cornus florida]|uniref:receptor-like protein kinase ANXUR2 n=1 Tax=Cornus florida TaxID=4283 RepID=UPI00289E92F6|nr:receptor-like protein kinase ANXUR2 [Cornus florida]
MAEIVARLESIALESQQGKTESYAEQEVIDFGGTSNENNIDLMSITSGDSTSTSGQFSILPIKEINERSVVVVEGILPAGTHGKKRVDYGSNQGGPLLSGWRLWDSLWQRKRPSSSTTTKAYSLAEIQAATDNFNDGLVIGKDGYRTIYAGFINETRKVAISRWSGNEFYDIFFIQLGLQSQLLCTNIVSLVGYCLDRNEMILVHEYMSNGSLFGRLHNCNIDNQRLSWKQRLQILIGAARGLNYLHTGVKQKTIVHRDVRPSNILLDQNWVAKIIPTTVAGYVYPEYMHHAGGFAEKSDVYSFGVVLLEVLSAREASSMEVNECSFLCTWAVECIEIGTVEQIIDPYLIGKISPLSLNVFVEIARICLLLSATKRPPMTHVVRTLEHALELQESADAALENQKNAAWPSVPQFGDWDQEGALPDYSLVFSKIREIRKQNKRDVTKRKLKNK